MYLVILSILRLNDIFYGHLVHFVVTWYIFTHFDVLYREKYSNPTIVVVVNYSYNNGFCFGSKRTYVYIRCSFSSLTFHFEGFTSKTGDLSVSVAFYWDNRVDKSLQTA
jgi:hypothetical protein